MAFSIHTTARVLGKAVVPLAVTFLALAPAASTPALADSPATITGKVTAAPARYLAETVVYLKNAPASHSPSTVTIDQKGMQFIPHVSAITVGDTVNFGNHDSVAHNVFSPDNEGFNLGTFPPNETRSYTFRRTNAGYSLLCSLHPEMLGYVFVGPNPYHAVVDASGNFTIRNVPAGTYSIGVWNSKLKAADQNVTVASGASATVSFSLTR
ncbi:MAG TPA: carboxypeptidase regulatory-like domain-containing protein [Polyangiaceae bacterium]|nr:carboxypeptidase regulatory-like domain-containing protein [Polyangiaceae bacterium]